MGSQFLDGDDWREILRDKLLSTQLTRVEHLDSRDAYEAIAVGTIKAGMPVAVIEVDGTAAIRLADASDGLVNGIALTTSHIGDVCPYVTRGFVFLESWQDVIHSPRLTPGYKYFLSSTEGLSQLPPASGFVISLGHAQSYHLLDVSIGLKIAL
jgi:hypothetical protein